MTSRSVTVAVEGDADEAVARALLEAAHLQAGAVHGKRGKDYLDGKLNAFNHAARHSPWLVLRDLDRAECAPSLSAVLLPARAKGLVFSVAVRSVESWLLADGARLARFLRIPEPLVPLRPDELPDPKAVLVELARRSRLRAIREDLVPPPGAGVAVGPGYTGRVIEFASRHWSPQRGAARSPSLRYCLTKLRGLLP